ncbi:MAG: hypothetical protein Q9160_003469 [Pyrenula sp. 1 TL-2023]
MSQVHISELAEYAKLKTRFSDRFTEHIYLQAGQTGAQRRLIHKEQWEYQKMLGQGAHGCVWQEKCVQGLEIKVRAVKMIRKFKAQKPWESINYTRELETIARFSHPMYETCFVKSFGWYESQEAVYIAMEYLTHGDLQTHLNLIARPLEPEAREISFQILEGLHYMHKHGFAHRDLKPANVLIKSMPPDRWWIKLCDFGISKGLDDGLTDSTLKGTMPYMAPELLDPAKDSHPRNGQAADMWALGEIISRMLTGEPTFKSQPLLWNFVQNLENFPLDRFRLCGIENHICELITSIMTARPEDRMTSEDALQTEWMKIYETPSLSLPDNPSHNPAPFLKPAFLMESSQVLESTSNWTTVSDLAHRIPATSSHSDGAINEPKYKDQLLPTSGVNGHPLDRSAGRQRRPIGVPPGGEGYSPGAISEPHQVRHSSLEPLLGRTLKRSRANRRATSPYNGRLANTEDSVPSSTRPIEHEPRARSSRSQSFRSSWNGSESGPRPATLDNEKYKARERSLEMVNTPQSDTFVMRRASFYDSGLEISPQESIQSFESSLAALSPRGDSNLASSPIPSLEVEARDPILGKFKDLERERPWEDQRERSTPRTAYRDQVRGEIRVRRRRRERATKSMVSLAVMKGDLKAQEDAKLIELEGDAVFNLKLSIWFAGLPSHQLHRDVRAVLKQLNIIYAEANEEYECWHTLASGSTRNRPYEESSLQPRSGYVHFKLSFWKKRAMVVVSDTHFMFEKLEGNITDYEDLVERLVATFERSWYLKPGYPTP